MAMCSLATDENISASTCVICAVGCGCVSVEVKWRTWQTKVSKWQCEKKQYRHRGGVVYIKTASSFALSAYRRTDVKLLGRRVNALGFR